MNPTFHNPDNCPAHVHVNWTLVMLLVLEENWRTMSDEQLSVALKVAPRDIARKRTELNYRVIVKREPKARVKKPGKKPLATMLEDAQLRHRRKRKTCIQQVMEKERFERRKKMESPLFGKRNIDYSKMISVRIDRRTVIQIPAGEDPEKAKAKFLQVQESYRKATNFHKGIVY
jgi:hypothetical protein